MLLSQREGKDKKGKDDDERREEKVRNGGRKGQGKGGGKGKERWEERATKWLKERARKSWRKG